MGTAHARRGVLSQAYILCRADRDAVTRRNEPRQEFAAVAQAFLVDAVADAGGNVPFDRDIERGQRLGGMEQGLRRDQIVAVAVDQQNRRPGANLGGEGVRIDVSGTTNRPE